MLWEEGCPVKQDIFIENVMLSRSLHIFFCLHHSRPGECWSSRTTTDIIPATATTFLSTTRVSVRYGHFEHESFCMYFDKPNRLRVPTSLPTCTCRFV